MEINRDKNLIYYIEDEPDLLELCRVAFVKAGFQMEGFSDGEKFVEIIKKMISGEKRAPAAFIVDILLPGISGMEILNKLRSQKEFDKIPVVVFTNYSTEEYKKEVEGYQNAQYILKTDLVPSQLVENVRKMMGRSENA